MKGIILSASVLLLLGGCKKEDDTPKEPQLPPASQSGANIFGCKIDGKLFSTKGDGGGFSGEGIYANFTTSSGDSLFIVGAQDYANENSFHFRFQYREIGTPSSVGRDWPFIATYVHNTAETGTVPGNTNTYNSFGAESGSITLTHFDGAIAAGTFQMTLANGNGDTVHITEGRFDARFD